MTRPSRYLRLAAAAALTLLVPLVTPAPTAHAASSPSGSVQLLSQTPWVQTAGTFELRVQLTADNPQVDRVQVSVFDHPIARTYFQAAANGSIDNPPFYQQSTPIAPLAPAPGGGVDLDLPIDTSAASGTGFPEVPVGETGVFPVQVSVIGPSGAVQGSPLTTFLVYASGPAASAGYRQLSVAMVVPFSSPVQVGSSDAVTAPAGAEAKRLENLADVLDQSPVPASVEASPLSVASVGSSNSATNRQTASTLKGISGQNLLQVLPATYSPASLAPLVGAGLSGEVRYQLAAGSSELASAFGSAPANDVWVDDGPMEPGTLATLAGNGFAQLVLPASDLAALPDYDTQTTFASPTTLTQGRTSLTVMAADEGISGDFSRDDPPVLAANILLAELAMIQTEEPGIAARGVVALPPAGWSASPQFVSTLLQGLEGNPLLSATTVSGLFKAVGRPHITRPLAGAPSNAGSGSGPGSQGGASGEVSVLTGDAAAITNARQQVTALAALLPTQAAQNAALASRLLTAESALVDEGTRLRLIGSIQSAAVAAVGQIKLPPSSSITLTSTKGNLPLTVLNAAPGTPQVELRLTSQRLIFHHYNPPGGTCTVPNPTSVVCRITLSHRNTTLFIPVETRSSGVFPLDVSLYSVGGGLLLAHDQDTVRSTAVSQVAIALMVLAVLSVAVWWGRDLRKGRRPASLVPSPDEDDPPADDGAVRPGSGGDQPVATAPPAPKGVSPLEP